MQTSTAVCRPAAKSSSSTPASMTLAAHRSCCGTATSRTSRTRAAAFRTTSAPPRSRRTARQAWVPSQAGQHQARHAARRPWPQLPEHRARDQLAHRLSRRQPRTTAARIDHDNAGVASAVAVRSARRLHVRRAGNQPRGRGGRCARQLARSSASTSAARRRASRCRADGRTLYVNNFMDRTVERVRSHARWSRTAMAERAAASRRSQCGRRPRS